MLRGTPGAPQYVKDRAPSVVNQLGVGDLDYNSLNGSGWSYFTQTDWSGGFQRLKFKDDASFKDGQAIDVIGKYGEVRLQHGWTSAASICSRSSSGTERIRRVRVAARGQPCTSCRCTASLSVRTVRSPDRAQTNRVMLV